jgi:hypothetical protein
MRQAVGILRSEQFQFLERVRSEPRSWHSAEGGCQLHVDPCEGSVLYPGEQMGVELATRVETELTVEKREE